MSVIVLGDYLLGKVELLKAASRSSGADIDDSTVSTTYETADLTALIGTDVAGAILYIRFWTNDGNERTILCVREVGDTRGAVVGTHVMEQYAARNATDTLTLTGGPVIIPCRGTDPGKFQYREHSAASHAVDRFQANVWGRIRP